MYRFNIMYLSDMANIIALTSQTFDAMLSDTKDKPVVIDFWAGWCVPCQMYAPIMELVATEMENDAIFTNVDVDTQNEIAQRYNIMSIPTTLIFFNSKIEKQLPGIQSREELTHAIKQVIGSYAEKQQ